ncbi:hypothetical protein CRI94_03385 [Longibacter salinarum]|uniref:DUF2339 domain-containing protein n=1 Tax=Longibacter salinarum TaxID=1850348 RepID=A0A2A8D384_9BACT|nr:DUF2339 domain-containing protein [Longibacter salinarum]PEN15334.1 hypothetical protein CRI94_03385 [Longibacter salinarum]
MPPDETSPRKNDNPDLGDRVDRLEQRVDKLFDAVLRIEREIGSRTSSSEPENDVLSEEQAGRASTSPAELKSSESATGGSSRTVEGEAEAERADSDRFGKGGSREATSSRRMGTALPGRAGGWLKTVLGATTEDWLSRIGIALLLFGLAFLFRYAVEQNWLGPIIRIAFGGGLGVSLLYAGLRLYDERPRFGQVLLGGSSATLYVSIFSAYQLYGLAGYPAAFALMVIVTLGTFGVAVRQEEPIMAVIGSLGAYATPFVLYTDAGSVPGLVGYALVVLVLTTSLFWLRGWITMLYTSIGGMWLVTLVAWVSTLSFVGTGDATDVDRVSIQVSAVAAWLASAVIPLAYQIVRAGALRERWMSRLPAWVQSQVENRTTEEGAEETTRSLWTKTGIIFASTVTPTLFVVITVANWDLGEGAAAFLMLVLAVMYALGSEWASRMALELERTVYAVLASLLVTASIGTAVDGPYITVLLAVQAAGHFAIARRGAPRALRTVGHILFLLVAVESFQVDLPRIESDLSTMTGRLIVAVLMFGSAFLVRSRSVRRVYFVGANSLLAAWTWHMIGEPSHALTWTRFIWALHATTLFAIARVPKLVNGTVLSPVRRTVGWVSHGLFLLVSMSFATEIWASGMGTMTLETAIVQFAVVGLFVSVAVWSRPEVVAAVYRLGTLVLWLVWTAHVVDGFGGGAGIVSSIWGATAMVGIIFGTVSNRSEVQYAGFATLLLVVAKLFLLDLSALSPAARIFIFLGFGIVLLLAGYLLPGLLPSGEEDRVRVDEEN